MRVWWSRGRVVRWRACPAVFIAIVECGLICDCSSYRQHRLYSAGCPFFRWIEDILHLSVDPLCICNITCGQWMLLFTNVGRVAYAAAQVANKAMLPNVRKMRMYCIPRSTRQASFVQYSFSESNHTEKHKTDRCNFIAPPIDRTGRHLLHVIHPNGAAQAWESWSWLEGWYRRVALSKPRVRGGNSPGCR